MVSHKCEICNMEFTKKSNYIRHIKKKNPCYPIKELDEDENVKYGCYFCDKLFDSKNALRRHINNLHAEDVINNAKIKNYYNKCKIINNNITNNIQINVYGEEKYHIKPGTWKKILNTGFTSAKVFAELIHFNKFKPENQNVYISNLRDQYVHVYTANGWEVRYVDEFISEFLENKEFTIFEIFDELKENGELGQRIIRKMAQYKATHEEDHVKTRNKKALKLLFYNKRKLPMEVKRMMENI